MRSWIEKFFENPTAIGAISPSSAALAVAMTAPVYRGMNVLELGPGTGVVTRHLHERLRKDGQLHAVEQDRDFCEALQKEMPSLRISQSDIRQFFQTCDQDYDAIVSGIPFAAMPKSEAQKIFQDIYHHLKPQGTFVMFQYSLTSLNTLRDLYPNGVDLKLVLWNLPPAWVYFCRK